MLLILGRERTGAVAKIRAFYRRVRACSGFAECPYNTMMISRFFFPEPLPASGHVRLPDALAHHATRVLRMGAGDPMVLFDGRGGEVAARLHGGGREWFAAVEAYDPVDRESPLELVLVQALASGDKMDWIVQKAVELGAAGVIPVETRRTVLRLSGERAVKRVAHWQQVMVSACEQSGRNRVPELAPIVSLAQYLATHRDTDKLMFVPTAERPMRVLGPPGGPRHLLIGPEGGWADDELAACRAANCVLATLGPRVLRTETAGLAALAAAQVLWGDV